VDSQNPSQKTNTFLIIWLGQVVSLVGSGLTSFALGVWVFERTGSATQFAFIGLAAVLPRVLLSPLAGTIVDRWDRRRVMIVADTGAGLSTLLVILLLVMGQLELWHIYVLTLVSAAFGTVQWPAFMAVTTLLVPKENLGRANGMVQFGQAASEILAPALAGFLMGVIGLEGVILVDVATFVFAVGTLLVVRLPRPEAFVEDTKDRGSLWQDLTFGWRYIWARPGLRGLLSFFTAVNFLWGMVGALIVPLILSWTSSDVLGVVISIAGVGMLLGSLIMSVWGGPRRRINGVLWFELLSGVCFLFIGFRPSFWPVAAGVFGAHMTIAIVYGSNQAIWQSKVAPDIQGRVFATQQMVARAASPLAYLLAGPLADRIFEPFMAAGGPLAAGAAQVVGSGAGRGIGLLFLLMGLAKMAVSLAGLLNPRIRHVEDDLPDAVPAGQEATIRADQQHSTPEIRALHQVRKRRQRLLEKDDLGRTPLFYAAEKGLEEEVWSILSSFGGTGLCPPRLALITTQDHTGLTAADVAEQAGHEKVADLLRKEQARMEYHE
jgi:MFS family permease